MTFGPADRGLPPPEPVRWVEVASYTYPHEARLAMAALEAEGVETSVADEHAISVNPFTSVALGGVRVRVAEEDLERARAVLAARAPRALHLVRPGSGDGEPLRERFWHRHRRKTATLTLAAGWLLPVIVAPAFYWCATHPATDSLRILAWSDLQATGGLAVGSPRRTADARVYLPVSCDVSRLPRGRDARDVRLRTERAGSRIYLELWRGSVRGAQAAGPTCGGVFLGEIEPGPYEVWYRDAGGAAERLAAIDVPAA